ncbi:replication initiator [Micromonospora sp. DT47]|uniref:replication initiator n=1 Tax=Micromonospora sp. DT47 TaxID=3393431 RepID=UPI003CF9D932
MGGQSARPGPGGREQVHKRETLGIGGRRVLISRQWSGKTLADHRADRKEWVKALLRIATDADTAPPGGEHRHAWELAKPTDPDVPPLGHRVLRAISERIQWRAQLDAARPLGVPSQDPLAAAGWSVQSRALLLARARSAHAGLPVHRRESRHRGSDLRLRNRRR